MDNTIPMRDVEMTPQNVFQGSSIRLVSGILRFQGLCDVGICANERLQFDQQNTYIMVGQPNKALLSPYFWRGVR